MGCPWCKLLSGGDKKTEETKGLLDETNKGADSWSKASEEEPYGVQTGFENEDEEDNSNGIQPSREMGSEAQIDSVLTVVQVNQEVGSEVTNLESNEKKPEDSLLKVEDGHTPDLNQKISGMYVEYEGAGSGHVLYPVSTIKNIHVEDPPKIEYLLVEPTTNRAEGGLSSSPKSEDVHRLDLFLKGESIQVAAPSLQKELEKGADPSLKSDPVKVEDPFMMCDPLMLGGHILKSEFTAVVEPTLDNEPVEVVDPFVQKETVAAADISLKNETLEARDPYLEKETVEAVDPSLEETVEAIVPSLKGEPMEDALPSVENEPAEVADPDLHNKTVEAVDPSPEYESIEDAEPSIMNEPTEVAGPSLDNETIRVMDSSLQNELVEAVVPSIECEPIDDDNLSIENNPIEVVDPSLNSETIKVMDSSLQNEIVEAVGRSIECEPIEDANLSIENEPIEVVDPSLNSETVEAVVPLFKNETVEAVDSSPKHESVETVDPSFKNETVEAVDISLYEPTENTDASINNDTTEVVEPSLNSPSLQLEEPLPGIQDMKAEDSAPKAVDALSVGPNAVSPDEISPPTDHEPCMENLSRPAHEDAAELESGTLQLEEDTEDKDQSGAGDTPAAVGEMSDLKDDSHDVKLSSQAPEPLLLDELVTGKSCTTEEEEPEDSEAKMVVLSKDIVLGVEEESEQEVREDEGIREQTDEKEEEREASKMAEASDKGEMESLFEAQEYTNQGSPEVNTERLKPQEADSVVDLDLEEENIALVEPEKTEPPAQMTYPGVQDKSSVAPGMDILSYCQREWKGSTAKSATIRKGYSVLSQCFEGLQRVRGDNYCALRATLFQVLSHADKLPAWIDRDDITLLPEKLAAEMEPVESWKFPPGLEGGENAVGKLKHHLELLQKTWRALAEAGSAEERRSLCQAIFQGGEEELALLEAVKLLMLSSAAELHARMGQSEEVPAFCWLLFARNDSTNPREFLANHLSQVGFGGGLEQVEMFLLGYTLQHTIQVYRLYMTETQEFITYYPDDHKEDWPQVCLVTEDDRHYNVLLEKLKGNELPEAPTVA